VNDGHVEGEYCGYFGLVVLHSLTIIVLQEKNQVCNKLLNHNRITFINVVIFLYTCCKRVGVPCKTENLVFPVWELPLSKPNGTQQQYCNIVTFNELLGMFSVLKT